MYGPALLRIRAKKLTNESDGKVVYRSSHDIGLKIDLKTEAKRHIVKPLVYLFEEYVPSHFLFVRPSLTPTYLPSFRPIVLLSTAYVSFLYAILQIYFMACKISSSPLNLRILLKPPKQSLAYISKNDIGANPLQDFPS